MKENLGGKIHHQKILHFCSRKCIDASPTSLMLLWVMIPIFPVGKPSPLQLGKSNRKGISLAQSTGKASFRGRQCPRWVPVLSSMLVQNVSLVALTGQGGPENNLWNLWDWRACQRSPGAIRSLVSRISSEIKLPPLCCPIKAKRNCGGCLTPDLLMWSPLFLPVFNQHTGLADASQNTGFRGVFLCEFGIFGILFWLFLVYDFGQTFTFFCAAVTSPSQPHRKTISWQLLTLKLMLRVTWRA